ncbi:ABC transporter permease subunit [Tumebacillus sp. DT12]|uniref:ABC transporter permease subunit n=1 Tax=Tumebacillus lacus TaxID=2995335 RepID=A0ABT3X742_9BACL|nr:ABC transporter permease subunit [Tumebacillus lacus]MCX7571808.1 ABC transporter permease subunit [Tumebacillus lacus]
MNSLQNLFPLNRALLWKEWMPFRGWYVAAFVLWSLSVILYPLGLSIYHLFIWWGDRSIVYYWSQDLAQMMEHNEGSSVVLVGMLLTVVLGVLPLASERSPNTMPFLTAMPVSRREVLAAKYLVNAAFLVGSMTVMFLMMVAYLLVFPDVQYQAWKILPFFVLTTSVFLLMYTITFFLATVAGNLLSAILLAVTALYAPWVWFYNSGMSHDIFNGWWTDYAVQAVILPCYNGFGCESYTAVHAPYLSSLGLLAVTIALYVWSVRLFEQNQMEHNGRLLMFTSLTRWLLRFAPVLIGLAAGVGIAGDSHSFLLGVLSFVGIMVGVYAGIGGLQRFLRRAGIRVKS